MKTSWTIDGMPVVLDENARFIVTTGEETFKAASLDALRTAVEEYTKRKRQSDRVRISVPYVTTNGTRGEVYGRHAGTFNWLVRIGDGAKQVRSYELRNALKLTDEDLSTYTAMLEERRQIDKRISAFETKHTFDAARAAEIAWEKASKEQA